MGKTFKDSSSKRDRGFRFSRNVGKQSLKTAEKAEKGKKMKHKRNFKTYEEADTYEE